MKLLITNNKCLLKEMKLENNFLKNYYRYLEKKRTDTIIELVKLFSRDGY